jgi:ubiquinone/menaquinone biosynthesis C-methylase UbiE
MKTEKEKIQAVWGATPAGSAHALDLAPGTKEFFEKTYYVRKFKELPFLEELIPYRTFGGKRLLEIGCGVGYDALDFCEHGVDYIGIDLTPENVDRCRKHLSFYGFYPQILQADAENLPFADRSMDIVFSNGVLHHTPDIKRSLKEICRVLKSGGEFWIILYHKHSIFHWITVVLADYLLKFQFVRYSYRERLSLIEYTTSPEKPIVHLYSRRQISELLRQAGFQVRGLWIRRLLREDFPNVFIIRELWKILPQKLVASLAKRYGWYVIACAEKTRVG